MRTIEKGSGMGEQEGKLELFGRVIVELWVRSCLLFGSGFRLRS